MNPIKSGDTMEDVVAFVRSKMWSEYGQKKKYYNLRWFGWCRRGTDEEDEEKKSNEEDDKMKSNWFFKGYFAYLAWGPFVEAELRLPIFGETEVEYLDNMKKKSRTNKRNISLATKTEGHSNDSENQCTMVL